MAKIYIAGPMSGLPNFNRDAFNAEAHRLLGLGHIALNPAILPDGLEQHQYMAICIEMVKMADQLVMLPGWERSAGARAEHALAIKLGKPVILLVAGPVRAMLSRFARLAVPNMHVLAYQEIPDNKQVTIVATVGQN